MEEESNGELAFFDTFLKQNNEKISILVYRNTTALTTKQVVRKVLFSPFFNRAYFIITNTIKMTSQKKMPE